jgi:hypothetical protein
MKGATKVIVRRMARAREAEDLRAVRSRDSVTFADVRFRGQTMPLSFAPYRLQAADRWWRESCLAQSTDAKAKRHQ